MKTLQTILIKLIGYVVLVIWGMICGIMLLIGFTTVKLSEVRIFKLLALIVFISLAACEKKPLSEPSGCWDCMIKQSNGIEYPAVYCCTEQEIILIANEQAVNGTKVTCEKR